MDLAVTHISLPEDALCTRPDSQGHCLCAVRTGGDTLQGFIELHGPSNVPFTVEVKLEGICRTWISNEQNSSQIHVAHAVSERQFLQEVDTIEHRPHAVTSAVVSSKEIRIPFSFVIPRRLISEESGSDARFLRLYPSVKLGSYFEGYPSGRRYMQPLIFYRLVATIHRKHESQSSQSEREVTIMPTQTPDPPLYVGIDKREYRLQSSVKIRRHIYGRYSGKLELSATEPVPLNLMVLTPRASTTVPIKLSFKPALSTKSDIVPYDWTIIVRSFLRMRVFCSTKPFGHEPTFADVGAKREIALLTRSTMFETRKYSNLSWRIDRLSKADPDEGSGRSKLPWVCRMQAIISAPKSLPPAFLAPTAALRYSIVLEIAVAGMKMSGTTIEVPVQVIRNLESQKEVGAGVSFWPLSTGLEEGPMYEAGDLPSTDEQYLFGGSEDGFDGAVEAPPVYRRFA